MSILAKLETSEKLSFEDTFTLFKEFQTTDDEETRKKLRKQMILLLDKKDSLHPIAKQMIPDYLDYLGLYPYTVGSEESVGILTALRAETHRSKYLKDVLFHEEQQKISNLLQTGKSVVLSAPTSFGKSLLIQEVVASKKYKNIVIIQPTLALLDETRKKLRKYSDDYKIIVSTRQEPGDKNVFLFTGERVVEYKNFPKIDFYVIDEFYKLSLQRDDDRAYVLNQAFYKLSKMTDFSYLLGPSIDSLAKSTQDKLKGKWIKSDFSTVVVDEVKIETPPKAKQDELFKILSDLLFKIDDPTLIYCSSPDKATNIARKFYHTVFGKMGAPKEVSQDVIDIIEWIDEQIHPDWILASCLELGIGIHHGSMPRHLSSAVIDLFNSGKIKYLFCTSTLIEGVNTSAKNIVLFDKSKGRKNIDFFDFQNIKGRSGRMGQYYCGRIYNFHNEPEQLEVSIDIPILSQELAPAEILVHISDEDLTKDSRDKLNKLLGGDEKLKDLFASNPGIQIESQMKIAALIEENLADWHPILNWTSYPDSQQLFKVLELIWNFMISSKDNKAGVRSSKHLYILVNKFLAIKSIKGLIDAQMKDPYWEERHPDSDERVNIIVNMLLSTQRQWFDFKLPKLLVVLSNIQKFVFERNGFPPGDFHFLASSIENSFISPSLLAIAEFDIPVSALRKIETLLGKDAEVDTSLARIKSLSDDVYRKQGILNYELKKIRGI